MKHFKLKTHEVASIVAHVVSVVLLCAFGCSSPSYAQDTRTLDDFVWKKDASTGIEYAASRNYSSFNYFDVGDLSYYSELLVEEDLRQLSAAAGLNLDRSSAKNTIVAVVHDTKVFSRLKGDKSSFKSLGLPDNVLAALEKQASDTSRCLNMTITDGQNNIIGTTVLLSEKYNFCLVAGLLHSFGIASSEISRKSLLDVCILYEGRRLGLRDRESLTRELSSLRDLCMAKAGETK